MYVSYNHVLCAAVRLAFLVDHPDRQIGVRFEPFPQDDLNEIRPANSHLGGNGVESIFRGRLQRDARDISEHQGSATKNDVKIRT